MLCKLIKSMLYELKTEASIKLPNSKPQISHYETLDGGWKSIEVWYVGMAQTQRVKYWNQTEQSTTKTCFIDWNLIDTGMV